MLLMKYVDCLETYIKDCFRLHWVHIWYITKNYLFQYVISDCA